MSNFRKFMLALIIGVIALISQFVFAAGAVAYWLILLAGGLTTISMLIGMIKTIRSGKYGVDILAITAIVATLAVGEYWASLIVLIMLTGGDSLEDYASRQPSRELRSLLDNSPHTAHKISDQQTTDLPVEAVKIGDIILVKPGETVPVDGMIISGESTVDESSLTGESRAVTKDADDMLMSGSVNGDGALQFRVTKIASDSQYQRLVRLVKESEAKPAHFVRLADHYAVPFTLIAYLIGGIAWFLAKDPVRFAEVLVVASPCPLILAAPVALVAGMSRSSRKGIVVKNGTTIEKLAKAKSAAFDKTGTITAGSLFVDQIESADAALSADRLLILAASAEQDSSHILARSLLTDAKNKKIHLLPVTNLAEVTGQGIKAEVDGQQIAVGKAAFAQNPATDLPDQTAVYVSIDGKYAGSITFKDTVRPEAKDTLARLKELGLSKLIMLTGDQQPVADKIAAGLALDEIHAQCLPEDKISLINNIPKQYKPIIMVGDGVNDAPALAAADVGIAMGAHGSTAASESADAVILKDDLSRVAEAVDISQDTMRIARQSVLIGIGICVFLMLVASTGVIPALFGAALQEVVDSVSILSSLRARRDH
ncbi:heavy metal translocating P-type ATPase [Oenococcus kitaharae]|uniref:Cd(2+)-exporting ATPase n=1 Tax=Oenococcus kitaharae DSM 17330 TaxID=1045004 RepID=G9WFP4_9LACO|nr:heavy metal translocating P-type ATPase [Oenococcus kitaharae]EHN59336.1 cadmium-/zinc-/cobalt-transporting ATPase [Oenococcus kitaharae DSM 17330]OEY82151.1 cobalt ABC transporter ATP-binding protein [Oenococcus kitaharae]OEY82574.1 cobalt ABC transporter ATP-binding protein [Oenococcus kitaharae]OEY84829.1 cobalt ABC transporter ATP-binding protein [Oenococcus kitaharae]